VFGFGSYFFGVVLGCFFDLGFDLFAGWFIIRQNPTFLDIIRHN